MTGEGAEGHETAENLEQFERLLRSLSDKKTEDYEIAEDLEVLKRFLQSNNPEVVAAREKWREESIAKEREYEIMVQQEQAEERRRDAEAEASGRSWLVGRQLTDEEISALRPKSKARLTLEEEKELFKKWSSDPSSGVANLPSLEHFLPVAIHILDMAAAGVVGAYTVSVRDHVLAKVLKRRHAQPQLQDAVAVRASARWAINQVYRDVLPPEAEPLVELVSPGRWTVVYDHAGWRYAASTAETADHDVQVQRQRL